MSKPVILHDSEGRFQLHGNVFDMVDGATPREFAESAWDTIRRWVQTGYQPVIEIEADGMRFRVDLEDPDDQYGEEMP